MNQTTTAQRVAVIIVAALFVAAYFVFGPERFLYIFGALAMLSGVISVLLGGYYTINPRAAGNMTWEAYERFKRILFILGFALILIALAFFVVGNHFLPII